MGEMHLIMGAQNISDGFRLSRVAFYSSIGTNGRVGLPLVKCISLWQLRIFLMASG